MKDDDVAPAGQRLSREGGDKGLSLGERLSLRLHKMQLGGPLHQMRLKGRFPLKLLAVPADPVAGDVPRGRALVADGKLTHAGTTIEMRDFTGALTTAPEAWRDWAHSFAFLRDIAAATDREAGARAAEKLVRAWVAQYAEFEPAAWRADLAGLRIIAWASHAPYFLGNNDLVHRSNVLNHLARAARHIERSVDKTPEGMPRLQALAGLLAASLLLPGDEARQAKVEGQIEKALTGVLLPDGGVASRAPLDHVRMLELLLTMQSFYAARQLRPAEVVAEGLQRVVPGVKALMLGDGGLVAMHGSPAGFAVRAARAIEASGVMEKATRNGRWSGVQRLTAGRVTLVLDAGPPPVARASTCAHAGTLAFELSDGPSRIFVNCGGTSGLPKPLPAELADGLRTTAAHTTLTLGDTNSTRIRDDGTLGRGVEEVIASRQESEEGIWVEASHDGYVRRHALLHTRKVYLSADGGDLRCADELTTSNGKAAKKAAGARFDVRFHLDPDVEASPTADGQGALLKLGSGSLWQFRARGGALAFEDSLVIADDGRPQPTQQLVITGETDRTGAVVNWSLKRVR